MKKALWITVPVLVAGLVFSTLWAADKPPFEQVGNSELSQLQGQGIKLIDIRRPEEWRETGVVPGSILLTAFDGGGRLAPDFPSKLETLVRKDEPFILICRTGNRTNALARALSEKGGYQRVYNVTNGITRWISGGGAVKKDCPSLTSGSQC